MKQLWSDWMKSLVVVVGLGVLAGPAAVAWGHEGGGDEVPLWQWEPEQFQQHVATVRSGKDLTPKSWPDGARVAVSFSFDFDTEPVWMGFRASKAPRICRGVSMARAPACRASSPYWKSTTSRPRFYPCHLDGPASAGH